MDFNQCFCAAAFVLASAVVCGCTSAKWVRAEVASDYEAPSQVTVAVGGRARGEAADRMTQALMEELCDELKDHGIAAERGGEFEDPPLVLVRFRRWEAGDRALRWVVGFGAGEGEVELDVDVLNDKGESILEGTLRGTVSAGFFGGTPEDVGAAAGRAIAKAIHSGTFGSRRLDRTARRVE